jgi:hypothetical protein
MKETDPKQKGKIGRMLEELNEELPITDGHMEVSLATAPTQDGFLDLVLLVRHASNTQTAVEYASKDIASTWQQWQKDGKYKELDAKLDATRQDQKQ